MEITRIEGRTWRREIQRQSRSLRNRVEQVFLESFQLNVPELAFDRGKGFIVAILRSAGHKRRIH